MINDYLRTKHSPSDRSFFYGVDQHMYILCTPYNKDAICSRRWYTEKS